MAGRSLTELMTGILGQVAAGKAAAQAKPASEAADLEAKLKEARTSGDDEAAQQVLGQITARRESLKEAGIKQPEPKKGRRRTSVGSSSGDSIFPQMSAEEVADLLAGKGKYEKVTTTGTPTITATTDQMRDISAEVNGWGAAPTSPGQWTPKTLAETSEVKEMEASPDGPKNAPASLASELMDRLEAHHAALTSFLKNLPDQLRAHAQHSPYFGPAHEHFAKQLEVGKTQGEITTFGKSDREALREKRDLIAASIPGGSVHGIRSAAMDQNLAGLTYRTPLDNTIIKGFELPSVVGNYTDIPTTSELQQQLRIATRRPGRAAKKQEALASIDTQIAEADRAARALPSHIKSLTIDLPSRLGQLKEKMNDIRENGVFQTDDPGVNHKAIMDIADSLSTINNSINSSIMAGTKAAIDDTFKGTGLSLQKKFKNFLGTSIHKKIFDHVKWMGKNLTQRDPGETWRWHEEPNSDWIVGAKPDNLTRILKGLATKQGLSRDDVLSKRGHIWGLSSKDAFGRRTGKREQIEISRENAEALRSSKDADKSGRTARDLGNHMLRIIKDYEAGNTAKYRMWELPAEWQPTSGKEGSGTRRITGSGDPKAQIAEQALYPYTEEAAETLEKRTKPIEVVGEDGTVTRVAAGTGGVFVKGTKNKPARSQRVVGGEAAVSRVARTTAVGRVKELSGIAGAVARAKKAGTTYDEDGNTQPISKEDGALLDANPEALVEVYNHVRGHQQLIEKHVDTVKTQGRNAIPKEDRKILGPSGMAEVNRRAKL